MFPENIHNCHKEGHWKFHWGGEHKSQSFLPFSPNSDQNQISPCNINAYSTAEVMRIKDMITQGEFS